MADDDKALMERLAALEAEVKADADEKEARKQAAMVKIREQQAAKQALLDEERESDRVVAKSRSAKKRVADLPDMDDVGGALELAAKANNVRAELTKAPKQGDKSWVKALAASVLFGPLGWLYAGSMREAIPASAAYIAFAAIVAKIAIPTILLWPIMLVGLPLSGLAGLTYALQYNRTGKRQRLFGDKAKQQKQLP
ncbi:MAG TPA: hypothetical protein VGM39_10895 [Kofleriaceae bacterium]